MKNFNFLLMLCGAVAFASCSESSLLGDNEMALIELNQTYELAEADSKRSEEHTSELQSHA